uniref:Polysaccharide biosynthesis protein CapD-like domain-containing protein n=1 Tax=viral metagenome TaxID=1070528 RepID=A0A6C0E3Z1_9ZZZZ
MTINLYSGTFFDNKTILITGGTGSLGNELIRRLVSEHSPKKIIVFSRDEFKQSEMKKKLSGDRYKCLRFFLGDIRDKDRLIEAFNNVDIVFHAAALKQVPALEYNPLEAIKTNIYGAENVIRAAIINKVKNVVAISTDKAVSPTNLYGATKLCFEKLFIAANNMVGDNNIKFSVVRYGNVFCSRGSVIPLFLEQSKSNKFTVTDPTMTRFNLTLESAVNFVLNCTSNMVGYEIFVPKLKSYNILQLCQAINNEAEIQIIGNRNGEKIHECMVNSVEINNCYECENYYIVLNSVPTNIITDKFYNLKKSIMDKEYFSGGDLLSIDEIKALLKTI